MEIFEHKGICLKEDKRAVYLDPSSGRADGAVTHAHSDHLRPRTHMTRPTADVMKVRTGSKKATPHDYHEKFKINDFELEFVSAGHVLGSAMIECSGVLYTGDYNPYGTVTAGIAKPQDCDTLIIESTYGKPDQILPDRNEVLKDLQAWIKVTSSNGGGIIGAYSLGKAQEVIASANKAGVVPAVSEIVASVSDVYKKHGVPLEYVPYTELGEKEKKRPGLLVTSTTATSGRRPDAVVKDLRRNGAKVARVSGWCAFASWAMRGVDAGFPISDHSDFSGTMKFIEECSPKQVYTVHGSTKELAKQVEKQLGISAKPLPKYGEVSIESFT
ncbi:MAG: MBL fold metallo-hydrolase [Dehalococcoidia bacterium]|nr:MBL fold metallo-hydrolase [Dehalococcoidia bacterium]